MESAGPASLEAQGPGGPSQQPAIHKQPLVEEGGMNGLPQCSYRDREYATYLRHLRPRLGEALAPSGS